jgi:serine phosphatase RsbU (regulator of sigma subunit)
MQQDLESAVRANEAFRNSAPRLAAGSAEPEARRQASWTLIAAAALLTTFAADYLSGSEPSLSLFYVVDIAIASWFVSFRTGTIVALLSGAAWALAYVIVGQPFSAPHVFWWNFAAEMGVFLLTAFAVSRARAGLLHERSLTRRLNNVRRDLERELRVVGDLQRQLLPPRPPSILGYSWEHHYETSTRAGGDYYDFFPQPDGRVGVIVADAAGHGAPAAVLMAMVRTLLYAAPGPLREPDRVLAHLGHQLGRALPQGSFVTACYALLDPPSGHVEYAVAGHQAPIVVRGDSGTLVTLPSRGGLPFGQLPAFPFESGLTSLGPGDVLVLYTDGVTEAMSRSLELFGEDRFRDVLLDAAKCPLPEMRRRVLAAIMAHVDGAPLSDDLTLILLRRDARHHARVERAPFHQRAHGS